jgi:hypothetical protein
MDSQLSLGDVTKSVFTPDFSSTYKSLSAGSTLCNMLTTNTIKQSISVDSSNKSEIKESEYKIKEAEKIISKNILFAIYNFNVSSKYSTYSSYLGKNIHTYDYTNLDNPEVPSFKKLNLYLEQINIILGNHSNIVASKDTGNQLYNSLQEFITEIKSSTENIYSIVMDNRISNVTDDDFIINAEKLFKGESSFKTKKFTGNKQNIASYFNSVKGKYLEIAKSVAGYNEGLQKTLIKFNSVMNKLATKYNSNYSQVVMQVEYKKEELRNVLYTFAMKYLNIANILYSIKAECIKEYLQPSYSNYDELITMKEDNSLDEYYDDEDFFNESADFEDEVISGDDRQVDFSYRTIELEEAFFAYTIKPMLETITDQQKKEMERSRQAAAKAGVGANPPKPAPAPAPAPEPEKKEAGAGTAQQPADAAKKVAGTKDPEVKKDANAGQSGNEKQLADADKESHIDKGGDVQGFAKWLKELWNKMMGFMKSLSEKISFAVSKSRDKLLGIINDFDSIKKINENLNKSDDNFTFRVYCNGDLKTMATRINNMKILQLNEIYPASNADDLMKEDKEAEKRLEETFKKSVPSDLKTFETVLPDNTGFDDMIENDKFPDLKQYTMALKNYFAGYDASAVKAAWNDITANTEGKAKNNILASTLDIAKIKQLSVNTIITNIKLIRIDQLKNQYNNMVTNGQTYIDKLCSIVLQSSTKAESAKITMESVLSEYFSDIVKINEDGNEESGKVDVEEVKKYFNTIKKVFIDYYGDPIYKSANYAYQQMCDNYYNIFNALLTGPVKVGETNNNQDQQPDQNNDQNAKEQPQSATPQAPTTNAAPQQPAAADNNQ